MFRTSFNAYQQAPSNTVLSSHREANQYDLYPCVCVGGGGPHLKACGAAKFQSEVPCLYTTYGN